MNRLVALAVIALALAGAAVATLQVDTDARAVLGAEAPANHILDAPEGRTVTLAILHGDPAQLTEISKEIRMSLAADRRVARVIGPSPSGPALLEFLWSQRFVLAPPAPENLTVEAMTDELRLARSALTDMSASTVAGRYLSDPTGSFRRLTEHLTKASDSPGTMDENARVIVYELADTPFDVRQQGIFDAQLRARIEAEGAEALIVGPRPISARISSHISKQSVTAMSIATILLLGWLVFVFRSIHAVLAVLLPLGLAIAGAALVLQAVFGAVHVLAIGFGGALLGLALDYPVHLISHAKGGSREFAARCIMLGASTTVLGFAALLLSGISAIAQVGVFVAVGLALAACASLWLAPALPAIRPISALRTCALTSPNRSFILLGIVATTTIGLALLPSRQVETLVAPPDSVRQELARLGAVMDLPSGRYTIQVTGNSLGDVLDRMPRVRAVANRLIEGGELRSARALSDLLPPRSAYTAQPSPEQFAALLPDILAGAGLAPTFEDQVADAYTAAFTQAENAGLPPDLPDALSPLIGADENGLEASVQLWDIKHPETVMSAIEALDDPAIRFMDRQSWIATGIEQIRSNVLLALVIGVAAALAFLFATLGRAAFAVVLGTVAAASTTALASGIIFGGIGVFQIMALVLVMGIGIDYGLLMTLDRSDAEFDVATGSVLLCAVSTLVAFGAMALSHVDLLIEIGTTVVIGVVAMVATGLLRQASRP